MNALDLLNQQHAKVMMGMREACADHPEITEAEKTSAAWAIVNHIHGWREFRFWAAEDVNGRKGWAKRLFADWVDAAPGRRAA